MAVYRGTLINRPAERGSRGLSVTSRRSSGNYFVAGVMFCISSVALALSSSFLLIGVSEVFAAASALFVVSGVLAIVARAGRTGSLFPDRRLAWIGGGLLIVGVAILPGAVWFYRAALVSDHDDGTEAIIALIGDALVLVGLIALVSQAIRSRRIPPSSRRVLVAVTTVVTGVMLSWWILMSAPTTAQVAGWAGPVLHLGQVLSLLALGLIATRVDLSRDTSGSGGLHIL